MNLISYTLHHCPDRGPNTARGAVQAGRGAVQAGWGAPRPIGATRKAIVLDGVHLDIKQIKYLVGVLF